MQKGFQHPCQETSVAKAREMFVCLRRGHISRECKSPKRCVKCNGWHHVSICSQGIGNTRSNLPGEATAEKKMKPPSGMTPPSHSMQPWNQCSCFQPHLITPPTCGSTRSSCTAADNKSNCIKSHLQWSVMTSMNCLWYWESAILCHWPGCQGTYIRG